MSATKVFARLRELLDVSVSSPSDGEVLTYDSGTSTWKNEAAGGGASASGTPIFRAFSFAYNTPGILTPGVPLYTPTPGDLLLDAAIVVTEPWNGTKPYSNIYVDTNSVGLYDFALGGPVDMTQTTFTGDSEGVGDGLVLSPIFSLLTSSIVGAVLDVLRSRAQDSTPFAQATFVRDRDANSLVKQYALPMLPAVVPSPAAPLVVTVSQNGSVFGDDPGSTQGQAVLYVTTVTPA